MIDKGISKQINPIVTETTPAVIWLQMASQTSLQILRGQWQIFNLGYYF